MAGWGFRVGGLEPALQKPVPVLRRIGNPLFVTVRQPIPQPDDVSCFPIWDTRLFSELDEVPGQLHHSIEPWSPVRSSAHLQAARRSVSMDGNVHQVMESMVKAACKLTSSWGSDSRSWEDREDDGTSRDKCIASLVDIREREEMVRSCSSSSSPNPSSSASTKLSGILSGASGSRPKLSRNSQDCCEHRYSTPMSSPDKTKLNRKQGFKTKVCTKKQTKNNNNKYMHGNIDTYPCTLLAWSSLVQDCCQEDAGWAHWGCAGARHCSSTATIGACLWRRQQHDPHSTAPTPQADKPGNFPG